MKTKCASCAEQLRWLRAIRIAPRYMLMLQLPMQKWDWLNLVKQETEATKARCELPAEMTEYEYPDYIPTDDDRWKDVTATTGQHAPEEQA